MKKSLNSPKSQDNARLVHGTIEQQPGPQGQPKKQPSELLELFCAIKKVPTLDERRALERKLKETQKLEEQEKQARADANKRRLDEIAMFHKDSDHLKNQQLQKMQRINKTNFKSFKLPEGDIYFGHVVQCIDAKLIPQGAPGFRKVAKDSTEEFVIVEDLALVPEEFKDKLQTMRHGFGINIYPLKEGRYAGDWSFNKKTGEGHMVYKDGSEYRGSLVNGVKQGYGQFTWPHIGEGELGHTYLGMWKHDKMHGSGRFLHRDQFMFTPIFANNLVCIEHDHFVTPFMTKDQIQDYWTRIDNKLRAEENDAKTLRDEIHVHHASNADELMEIVEKVRLNGRTPVILSTLEHPQDMQTLIQIIDEHNSTIDLRQTVNNMQQSEWQSFRESQAYCFEQKITSFGHTHEPAYLNIVLDDCVSEWQSHFDPHLDVLFGKGGFDHQIWRGENMFNQVKSIDQVPSLLKEMMDEYVNQQYQTLEAEWTEETPIDYPSAVQLVNEHLLFLRDSCVIRLAVLSKTKFSSKQTDAEILEAFKERFQRSVPINCCDCVIVHGIDQQQP